MIVKPLTEHHLEFLSLKEAAEARPSLHLSKCQISCRGSFYTTYQTVVEAVPCDLGIRMTCYMAS